MQLIWKIIAKIISKPFIANAIIKHVQKNEYFHLRGYMERWWVFNAFDVKAGKKIRERKLPFLPSIRIHHILREDYGRDPHDHPWNARTIILKGNYTEQRYDTSGEELTYTTHERKVGDTAKLMFGEYHMITRVSEGGAWTFFISWKHRGDWGFWKDKQKISNKIYCRTNGFNGNTA